MFDALTISQMYALHTSLARSAHKIHVSMIEHGKVFSPDWCIAGAAHDELSETMFAITAEIGRREQLARAYPVLDVPRA